MHHLAIMKKSWRFTEKILNGQKRIESRWYKTRHLPWGKVKVGDTIYFKNSGEPVKLKAIVSKVITYDNLTSAKVMEILGQFGEAIGIERAEIAYYFESFKTKKYCILIFLKSPQAVKPFEIDKQGFGNMAAWLTVENIKNIQIQEKIFT